MSDTALLRIGILAAGLLLIAAIFLFGRPKKKPQGRRVESAEPASGERREQVLGEDGVVVADGRVEADGEVIYLVKDMKVALSES